MLTSLVPVMFTFYIQCVLKLKKNNSGSKGLSYTSNSPSAIICLHDVDGNSFTIYFEEGRNKVESI